MKKVDKNNIDPIDGQLSIFDIQITEKPKKVTQKAEMAIENSVLVTEKPVLATKIITKVTPEGNEKTEKPLELTEKQKDFLNKNKVMENGNLSRIIIHAKGSITVEIKESDTFTSQYINPEGKEEFSYSNRSTVLPWDKIFYSAIKEVPLTEIQETKVQKLINEHKDIRRIVKRKGDENIILELEEGILSINSIGWELPFESVDHVECSEDEVYLIPDKEEVPENKDAVAKVGDYVQVDNGKEIIEGTLFSQYNSGHTFNIVFANSTKHTAIPRVAILKVLKSA